MDYGGNVIDIRIGPDEACHAIVVCECAGSGDWEWRLVVPSKLYVTTDHFHDERLDIATSRTLVRVAALTGASIDDPKPSAAVGEASLSLWVESPRELVQSVDDDEPYFFDL
jgi:hypothetical protein